MKVRDMGKLPKRPTGSQIELSDPDKEPSVHHSPTIFNVLNKNHNRSRIKSLAQELRIPYLVHFTRCENLPSIFHNGLMSIEECRNYRLDPAGNDHYRFDGRPDGTSLSVAFPNYRMFWKYRRIAKEVDRAVLLISSQVLWEKDCAFYQHNSADARMSRKALTTQKSAQSLRDMHSTEHGQRSVWLNSYDPTDDQAEVMVFEIIETDLIEGVVFETARAREQRLPVFGKSFDLYLDFDFGLFSSREYSRKHSRVLAYGSKL